MAVGAGITVAMKVVRVTSVAHADVIGWWWPVALRLPVNRLVAGKVIPGTA